MTATRQLFFLVAAVLVCILGGLLAFNAFGNATVPDLLGVGFIALGCLAASFLPPGAP
jgi:hypothetical protein